MRKPRLREIELLLWYWLTDSFIYLFSKCYCGSIMSQVVSGVEEGNLIEECNLQGLGVFLFVNNILVFMS